MNESPLARRLIGVWSLSTLEVVQSILVRTAEYPTKTMLVNYFSLKYRKLNVSLLTVDMNPKLSRYKLVTGYLNGSIFVSREAMLFFKGDHQFNDQCHSSRC
jgi:hypothetical protein